MKPGISAVIVVKNQKDLLQKCLSSIAKWVDEIILIDLESTDDIATLAKRFKTKYYLLHKNVLIVEEIRQASLKYISHEYVLFLDPDETISPDLAEDLSTKARESQYDYLSTPRQNFVFGKWVKHSRWWPDYQTRLFRHNKVTWGKALHSEPAVTGSGFKYDPLEKFAIRHNNYRSLDEYFDKNLRYAKADAQDRFSKGSDFTLSQTIKLSVSELISRFFADKGYKDGMHGLILAILQSFYYFLVYAYYWEGQQYRETESERTIKAFPKSWFSHGLAEVLHWDRAKSFTKTIKEKLVRRMIA